MRRIVYTKLLVWWSAMVAFGLADTSVARIQEYLRITYTRK